MRKQIGLRIGLATQRVLLPVLDLLAVNGSFWLAALLLSNFLPLSADMKSTLFSRMWYVSVIYLSLFYLLHLYTTLWKYAGSDELVQCASAAVLAAGICYFFDWVFETHGWHGIQTLPPSMLVLSSLLIVTFCGGLRVCYRTLRRLSRQFAKFFFVHDGGVPRVMVVGAGDMGNIVLSELRANHFRKGVPVVVVDDDRSKQGKTVYTTPIRGGCERIPWLAERYRVDRILISIPSASAQRLREITRLAVQSGREVRIAPSVLEIRESGENASLGLLREVRLEDLLMREQVKLDKRVCAYLQGQTVLVTGGGGSIGSEICRQVAFYHPAVIVIFDIYENNAYDLKQSMDRSCHGQPRIEIRIGSVCDQEALEALFTEFCPTVVFHAAAHKHVPLMELCPCEAVKNNIFGTYNTAETARRHGVDRFVLLSTDKAVNPTNVMGATKRVTELIMQGMAQKPGKTRFTAVRFGNVLNSSGSVIPLFREQIRTGGPVTVTDANITRYFMSIPEAAQLVAQAGGLAKGGETFVLDMGEPVHILTLAEQLVRLSGLRPYEDIDIQITGLRPGEKLSEELVLEEELAVRTMTENNKIFVTASLPVE
ncbi:MAG: polysaccharide biosynthesis protein, partial [Oscillospiraceae bacterium]|nr:polysaccharide biosynthesis protein [Oscillospiraceae bacterium]